MVIEVKKNGFTLIELLAALVILGILMAVAVPNVLGILNQNKITTYIEDTKKLATTAEYKFRGNNSVVRPTSGNCIIMSLTYLDQSEFESPPNEGEYLKESSFVVIKRSGSTYEYYPQLIEKTKTGAYRGVLVVNSKKLYEENLSSLVTNITSTNIVNVTDYMSSPNATRTRGKIGNASCSSIQKIY